MFEIPENYILDSHLSIEEVLEEILDLEHKIDHWEAVKKHRIETANQKITSIQSKIDDCRKIILETMKHHTPNDKTLDFSPLAKVTRKQIKAKWTVENEEELLVYLQQKKMKSSVVETKEVIVKKKLDEALYKLFGLGQKIEGASIGEPSESLSIVFGKPEARVTTRPSVVIEELEAIEI